MTKKNEKNNSLKAKNIKKKVSRIGKGVVEKTKKSTKEIEKKTKKASNSSAAKKAKSFVKKASSIVGSRLAVVKTGLTLSNEESKLLEELKKQLNANNVYPSKSEIIKAGLWALKKMSTKELVTKLQNLVKVKRVRVL